MPVLNWATVLKHTLSPERGALARLLARGRSLHRAAGASENSDVSEPAEGKRFRWFERGLLEQKTTRVPQHQSLGSTRCSDPTCPSHRAGRPRKAIFKHTFQGQTVCSAECLRAHVARAVRHGLTHRATIDVPYQQRMPLGLLLLSRRAISREQLTRALAAQHQAGQGRIGEWLVAGEGLSEKVIAQALATQWSLPVLPERHDFDPALRALLPAFLASALGVVSYRIAAGSILYVAVDRQMDRQLQTALETMTGLRVEPGVMTHSGYTALRRFVLAEQENAEKAGGLVCADSASALEAAITRCILERAAIESRLEQVGEYSWLRLVRSTDSVPDLSRASLLGRRDNLIEHAVFSSRGIRQQFS